MSILKGWWGEKKTSLNIWWNFDKTIYKRFHNIIIPTTNGTTQIDHLLLSKYGIFIVETKNYNGWIFGSEDNERWTQVIYGKKYYFQNPLRQTYRQKKSLSEFLVLNDSVIHTIVYFVGDCEFKTIMPKNVLKKDLYDYISQFSKIAISPVSFRETLAKLQNHISTNTLTRHDHINSLHDRHSSIKHCPKCGSTLVLRTARRGPNAGNKFLGCTSYPKCRYTRNV